MANSAVNTSEDTQELCYFAVYLILNFKHINIGELYFLSPSSEKSYVGLETLGWKTI